MKKYISLLVLGMLCIPHTIFAYTTILGKDESLRVDTNVNDNLYVAGGKVDVRSSVSGDLFAAGGELLVTGNISDNTVLAGGNIETSGTLGHDLFAAGGDIRIKGQTLGDVKITGGTVVLEKSASGDVNIAGGSIRIDKDVQIGKDLGIIGGNIVFQGTVHGNANIRAESLDLDGIFDKDVTLNINNISGLHIGPAAKITGKLSYSGKERIPELEKIAIGGTTFSEKILSKKEPNHLTNGVWEFVFSYVLFRVLSLIVLGALLLHFIKKPIEETGEILRKTPGKSFFRGLLYFVLIPFIALMCFVTVIGIPVGFLVIAFYIFSFVFYKLITFTVVFECIMQKWGKKFSSPWKKWSLFMLLALLFAVINGIDLFAAMFVFGAIITLIGKKIS